MTLLDIEGAERTVYKNKAMSDGSNLSQGLPPPAPPLVQPPRGPATDAAYYEKGSVEAATETALTLTKLRHRLRLTRKNDRLVIVLVGLPGRGKSFIARKLQNFVTWRGSECRVFNVGKYRRADAGGGCDASFFDATNKEASKQRENAAASALADMLGWLDAPFEGMTANNSANASSASLASQASGGALSGGTATTKKKIRKDRVAIFDATNSTRARRDWVLRECTCGIRRAGKSTGVVFVESICDDADLLRENFLTKVHNSPDYAGVDPEEAMADLLNRVTKYEEQYETIECDSKSYIKIYNLSSKMLVNHIYGRMAKSIVPALMAWNIGTRPVFICRAGQTGNKRGSESHPGSPWARPHSRLLNKREHLAENGIAFRDALRRYTQDECLNFLERRKAAFCPDLNTGTSINGLVNSGVSFEEEEYVGHDGLTSLPFPCHIMTSTMPRARQTVEWEDLPYPVEVLSNLNPLDKGDFSGHELEEIAERDPEWYEELTNDPFSTRFPGGECYGDLMARLESIVVNIEQQVGPVLLVSHVSVLQALVSYFRGSPAEECAAIEIPLNTVLKFTPSKGGGWAESTHRLLDSSSPSQSECDLSDEGIQAGAGGSGMATPNSLKGGGGGIGLSLTPMGSQIELAEGVGGGSGTKTPGNVSPLPTPKMPIWGDHVPLLKGGSRDPPGVAT